MTDSIIIFGCGSQAVYVIDNLRSRNIEPVAAVDLEKGAMVGGDIEGVPVRWGLDDALAEPSPDEFQAIVAHGDNALKMCAAEALVGRGFRFRSALHRHASISPAASVGEGCILNAGAVVMPRARIGAHVIVHAQAVVEHDCDIADGANIAPGVSLAGRVTVGTEAYLYTGCSVAPEVTIGARAVVGAGAVVLDDVAEGDCVVGNPARPTS